MYKRDEISDYAFAAETYSIIILALVGERHVLHSIL